MRVVIVTCLLLGLKTSVCFENMSQLTFAQVNEELKKPETILIDVRNPEELKTDGKIAQSKNIPLGELADALKAEDGDFKAKFGFVKPKHQDHIVVHCKSGARAQKGAQILAENGYTDIKVYPGIQDWKTNGGGTVV